MPELPNVDITARGPRPDRSDAAHGPGAQPAITAIFSAPFLGGSELFNLEYLRRVHARGVEIDAIVPGAGAVADALAGISRSVHLVGVPNRLQVLSRFDRRVRLLRLLAAPRALWSYSASLRDALARTRGPACCFGFRSQLATWVQRPAKQGRPVIWVVHEVVPPGPMARLWRRAALRASAVFAYSRAAAEQEALSGAAVTVVPPTFDLSAFSALAPPASPPRRIGLIGDLFPLKNHLAVPELVRRLRGRGLEVEGVLVGRGQASARPELAAYARDVDAAVEQAGGGVELVSPQPDEVPGALARIDLLVHLSTVPESFGRVCVEAMAAGRPVVAFGWGAVGDIVRDGETGLLCPPNDLDSVEAAIAGLIGDPARFTALAARAREHALEAYGEDAGRPTLGDALADFAYSHPGALA